MALAVCVAIGAILAGPAAQAQVPGLPGVPGTPGVPDLPPQIQDAIDTAQDTLMPVLIDAATAAEPAVNAGGFALRPACSASGTLMVLLAIAGGGLPISAGFVMTPVLLMCAGAYDPGPADPVFKQIDGAVGPQLEDAVDPVLDQAETGLDPVRPELSEVCSVLSLTGSPTKQLPPPAKRFDITGTVC